MTEVQTCALPISAQKEAKTVLTRRLSEAGHRLPPLAERQPFSSDEFGLGALNISVVPDGLKLFAVAPQSLFSPLFSALLCACLVLKRPGPPPLHYFPKSVCFDTGFCKNV